jgi:polyhydroxyalkanoate synthase
MAIESTHSEHKQQLDQSQRKRNSTTVTPLAVPNKPTAEPVPASRTAALTDQSTASADEALCRGSRMQAMMGRSYISPQIAQTIDRKARANFARLTFGLSPSAIAIAYFDWINHLTVAQGKQARMAEKALRKLIRLGIYAVESIGNPDTPKCIEPLPQDKRFNHPAWRRWPYNLISQAFLLNQQWWHNATIGVEGVSKHNEQAVTFMTRQLLDMVSPSNNPLLNPEIIETTFKEGGSNLLRGLSHFISDTKQVLRNEKPAGTETFQVGRDVAVTPGKVIYRNRIMELIQYSPTTDSVYREPVLMLSAWMMKYYIMDLSPNNSMVKYLVDHGHTVFMISWVNPGPDDRDLSMDDYRTLGIMEALDAITTIIPNEKVHAVGYCLGGILLSITAATMARDGDKRLASITLFTTMTDFTDVGELAVFLNPSGIAFIEDMMWDRGYLDPKQATGGFQLLKSRDLIWSKMVREYFLGEREPMFDLMAWNADTTRMPYRQHSELISRLYRDNELAEGHYRVNGRTIALSDIHIPIFAVAAERDHVAPWRSVYKLHLQSNANELTFVLTSGGHNVGIISELTNPHSHYQIATREEGERYASSSAWQEQTPKQKGSWWPAWQEWLAERSTQQVEPRALGAPEKNYPVLGDAPGTYVFQQ